MRVSSLRLALLGLVLAPRLFATPVCMTDTLANYIALNGGGGCTINLETVDAFAFGVGANNLVSPLTAANIMVTPMATVNGYQLFFFATGNTTSTGFFVTGSQFVTYEIDFTWDPLVTGAEDDMIANTPVPPGDATVTTNLCAGSLFGVGCPPPTNILTVFNNGIPAAAISTATTGFAPVTVVGTQSFIKLEGNTLGSSEITGFKTSVFNPEPGAAGLVAGGLLALLWARFRYRDAGNRRTRPAL